MLLGAAPSADAYEIGGQRWPGRTITYFDAGPVPGPLEEAVEIWNESGVRVRFKAVPRSSARVVVIGLGTSNCVGVTGYAQLGYEPGSVAQVELSSCRNRRTMVITAVHELGHILGLDHSGERCAVMTASGLSGCRTKDYMVQCRTLQADDLRGALKLYGGRAEPLGPALCPTHARPKPVKLTIAGTGADSGSTVEARVEVRRPKALIEGANFPPPVKVTVFRRPGTCKGGPARGVKVAAEPLFEPGRTTLPAGSRLKLDPGRYCYTASVRDALGRSSDRLASAEAEISFAPPVARFRVPARVEVGESFSPDDRSATGEKGPLDYAWDFGDPTTTADVSAARAPDFAYATPGTYTVTLTVRDRIGAVSSAVRTIEVPPPPPNQPPVAGFSSYADSFEPLRVFFSDESYDTDGQVVAWNWSFGDGTTSTETYPEHLYARAGTYTVTLTVTDDRGATAVASSEVVVEAPPP